MTIEQVLSLFGLLIAFAGAITGAARWSTMRSERMIRELERQFTEDITSARREVLQAVESLRELMLQRFAFNTEAFRTVSTSFTKSVETLAITQIRHGEELAVLKAMAERWEQGRLRPENGEIP